MKRIFNFFFFLKMIGKLLSTLLLVWIGFVGWMYVSFTNLEDILLDSMNGVIDDTMNVVSTQVQDSFDETKANADASVDQFVAEQKANLAAKLEAEKEKLKAKIKADVELYIKEKVNFIFGSTAETEVE